MRTIRLALVTALVVTTMLAGVVPATAQLTPQTLIDIGSPVVVKSPGSAGVMEFPVVLRHRVTQTVSVSWITARDTAIDGQDYIAETGVRTFSPGRLTPDEGPIRITLLPTDPYEGTRRFRVNLVEPVANAGLGVRSGTGTIVPRATGTEGPTVQIQGGVEVREGGAGATTAVVFPVRLSEVAEAPVVVRYRTSDGTAISATGDYAAVADGMVAIPAGKDEASISITVNGDTLAELDEWFEVVLTGAENAAVGTSTSGHRGRGVILNDDGPHLTIADVTRPEGPNAELTAFQFTVTLRQPAQGVTTTVDFATQDGSARASNPNELDGSDYSPTAGTLTFAPGVTQQTVTVQVIGDNWPEPTEGFFVTLGNAQTSALTSGITILRRRGVGTIVNDDGPGMAADDVELQRPEATPVTVQVPVTVSGDASRVAGDYRVHYRTVDGSAVAGQHYKRAVGVLEIAREARAGSIEVEILPAGEGPTRTFAVELFLPDYAQLTDARATVTVLGDPGEDEGSQTGEEEQQEEAEPPAPPQPQPDADTDAVVDADADAEDLGRVAGTDRIGTAVAVSRAHWEQAEAAVLATAASYPDALSAVAVAGGLDAPMLLTHAQQLPDQVAAELDRLGTRRVWIMGGPAAVSQAVEDQLRAQGLETVRLSGRDRFATAAAAARSVGLADSGEVVLALGAHTEERRAWPDALSAGALSASPDQLPVLLTLTDRIPVDTEQALAELDARRVVLLGGQAAISEAVAQRLAALGYEVARRAGATRYATSAAAATDALARWGDRRTPVVFATGENFPDGLAAGALAAHLDGILLLVPGAELAPEIRAFLRDNRARLRPGVIVGGPTAISESVHDELRAELDAT